MQHFESSDIQTKSWRPRSPEEIEEIAQRKRREGKSLSQPLLIASSLSLLFVLFWAIGLRGKQPPGPAKSWDEIINIGPLMFFVIFIIVFLVLYVGQRCSDGALLDNSSSAVKFCPKCHTPQYEHERKCDCEEKLEPLNDWTWE